jgi:hypothetical protein
VSGGNPPNPPCGRRSRTCPLTPPAAGELGMGGCSEKRATSILSNLLSSLPRAGT